MGQKYIIRLTPEEREELIAITKTGRHAAQKIIHAKIGQQQIVQMKIEKRRRILK